MDIDRTKLKKWVSDKINKHTLIYLQRYSVITYWYFFPNTTTTFLHSFTQFDMKK